MLLVLLKKGRCRSALDAVAGVLGSLEGKGPEYLTAGGEVVVLCHESEGATELLDSSCPTDYLVLHLNTGDYYSPSQVTPDAVSRYREKLCSILDRMRGLYYLAVATTQPYLTVYGVYFGKTPPPVVALGVELGDDECAERLYRAVAASDVVQLDLLPAPPPPKLEKLCGK
jgi:hypothetical protein